MSRKLDDSVIRTLDKTHEVIARSKRLLKETEPMVRAQHLADQTRRPEPKRAEIPAAPGVRFR